jgi:hypothetical protein
MMRNSIYIIRIWVYRIELPTLHNERNKNLPCINDTTWYFYSLRSRYSVWTFIIESSSRIVRYMCHLHINAYTYYVYTIPHHALIFMNIRIMHITMFGSSLPPWKFKHYILIGENKSTMWCHLCMVNFYFFHCVGLVTLSYTYSI